MNQQVERELRELFSEDAQRAASSAALAEIARRVVARRRQTRRAWTGGILVAATATVAATVVAVVTASDRPADSRGDRLAASPRDATGTPLPDSGARRCVEQYSSSAIAGRAFAFDGTVTTITAGQTDQSDSSLALDAVTFTVNEWFVGGSDKTVTVDMMPPDPDGLAETPPIYDVGTRLLVSGEPRWGGAPLTDPVAWGCGFTRYYDDATADNWRAATAG
jgi:hypothetical protein